MRMLALLAALLVTRAMAAPVPVEPAATWPASAPFALAADPQRDTRAPPAGQTWTNAAVITERRAAGVEHQYSRRSVWNRDQTRAFTGDRLMDPDLRTQIALAPLSSESTWTSSPDRIIGIQYGDDGVANRLVHWNVRTGAVELLERFVGVQDLSIGRGEGSPSHDDALIVLVGTRAGRPVLISYDVQGRHVLAERAAHPELDWASASPSGRWVIADEGGQLVRYEPDLTNRTVIAVDVGHGDLCHDATGAEVYAALGEQLRWIRLADGATEQAALPAWQHGHLSCRALDRPGWAYLSLDSGQVGAVQLRAGSDQWEPWGWHRSSQASYRAQPKISASPDGRRFVVASDWYGGDVLSDTLFELSP